MIFCNILEGQPQPLQDVEKSFQLEKYFDKIKPLVRHKIDFTLIPVKEL